MRGKNSFIFMHEKGHSAWDKKLDWAAEYVNRITDKLRKELEEKLNLEKTERGLSENEIKESIQKNSETISKLEKDHELDITDLNAIKNTYASTTQAGLIRLGKDGSGANKSGLIVDSSDGTCNVYCDPTFGTERTGGRVAVSPATEAEIKAGTQERKPIVPKTLNYAVNTVMGDTISNINKKISDLKSTQQILANKVADLLDETLKLRALPEEHADDLNVNETGFYLDLAGKTHSGGVEAPGVLLVFNANFEDEIYRFYLSYQTGLFVQVNDNTWVKR